MQRKKTYKTFVLKYKVRKNQINTFLSLIRPFLKEIGYYGSYFDIYKAPLEAESDFWIVSVLLFVVEDTNDNSKYKKLYNDLKSKTAESAYYSQISNNGATFLEITVDPEKDSKIVNRTSFAGKRTVFLFEPGPGETWDSLFFKIAKELDLNKIVYSEKEEILFYENQAFAELKSNTKYLSISVPQVQSKKYKQLLKQFFVNNTNSGFLERFYTVDPTTKKLL